MPLYPGGEAELVKELGACCASPLRKCPPCAASNLDAKHDPLQLETQVDVELAVSPEGQIIDARVAGSTAQYLNRAALRAVAKLKRQFVPGRRDGQAMASYLTVPVYYTSSLNGPYRQRIGSARMGALSGRVAGR